MRLLITPIHKDSFEEIRDDVFEIETSDIQKLQKTLYSLKEGDLYFIEVYKNFKDYAVFQLAVDFGKVFYIENREELTMVIVEDFYDHIIKLIKIYSEEKGSKELKSILYSHIEESKKIEKEKFEKWKVGYNISREKEKKNNIIKYSITFVIVIFLLALGYLKITNNLQFIGRKKITKKAVVTNTNFWHIGNGYYLQTVNYEFEFKKSKYKGKFEAGKSEGKHYVGDSIFVTFLYENPEISKRINKK